MKEAKDCRCTACRIAKVGKGFAKALGEIDGKRTAKRLLRQVFVGQAWL